jgi:hypothetical protein
MAIDFKDAPVLSHCGTRRLFEREFPPVQITMESRRVDEGRRTYTTSLDVHVTCEPMKGFDFDTDGSLDVIVVSASNVLFGPR